MTKPRTSTRWLQFLLLSSLPSCLFSLSNSQQLLSRRAAASSAAGLAAAAAQATKANAAGTTIADRLTAATLAEPPVKQGSEWDLFSKSGLYDDLFYPQWMAGTWDAVSTLRDFSAPQGATFLTGPNGNRPDVAQAVIAQERSKIGSAVGPYKLRYLTIPNSRGGAPYVVEDRAYNLKSRLNAFAGKDVVKDVEYVEVGGANRIGYGDAPLPTTLTRFRGSAVQKTFSNNRGADPFVEGGGGGGGGGGEGGGGGGGVWTGFEFQRTLFARTDPKGKDQPPVVTDTQVITQLQPPVRGRAVGPSDAASDLPVLSSSSSSSSSSPSSAPSIDGSGGREEDAPLVVRGRVRIADYLTPQDQLFFNAKQQAVAISDYDVTLTQVLRKPRASNATPPAPPTADGSAPPAPAPAAPAPAPEAAGAATSIAAAEAPTATLVSAAASPTPLSSVLE